MNISNKKKGIFFIIIAGVGFALMGLFVNLSGNIPTIQKAFFRNIVPIFVAGFALKKVINSENLNIKRKDLIFLILRSIFGTLGIICNFYAIDHLKLSDANMLNKLSPFFVIIFSFIILKEKITIFQSLAIGGAFIGALFIIKPTGNMSFVPAFLGALGGMMAGVAYTMVRLLGKRGINGNLIIFFFSTFSCIICLPFFITKYAYMNIYQIFMLLLSGLAAAVGQIAITKAYFYAPAKQISIYDYNQIIVSALLGFIFLNQIPDIYSFIGYAIIFAMGFWMYIYEEK